MLCFVVAAIEAAAEGRGSSAEGRGSSAEGLGWPVIVPYFQCTPACKHPVVYLQLRHSGIPKNGRF